MVQNIITWKENEVLMKQKREVHKFEWKNEEITCKEVERMRNNMKIKRELREETKVWTDFLGWILKGTLFDVPLHVALFDLAAGKECRRKNNFCTGKLPSCGW